MKARLMIWLMTVGAELQWRAGLLGHLTTDPACREYRRPRPGSRLDKVSRGWSCDECMKRGAFGHDLSVFEAAHALGVAVDQANRDKEARALLDALGGCTCPSGDGSLRWPCPTHPPTTDPTNGGLEGG